MPDDLDQLDEGWTTEERLSLSREFVESDDVQFLVNQPDHVISLIHGIRDLPTWQGPLAQESRKYAYGMALEPVSVGWIDPFSFIFRCGSAAREAHVLLELEAIRRKYPAAKHSIVAHSYGTDMLARVSMKLHDRYELIFLCGAVCKGDPSSWNLDNLARQVINDCSTKDVYPAIAHSLNPTHYEFTGTYGFRCSRVQDRFWECKHGAYVDPRHFSQNVFPIIAGAPVNEGRIASGRLFMRLPFVVKTIKFCLILLAICYAIL